MIIETLIISRNLQKNKNNSRKYQNRLALTTGAVCRLPHFQNGPRPCSG